MSLRIRDQAAAGDRCVAAIAAALEVISDNCGQTGVRTMPIGQDLILLVPNIDPSEVKLQEDLPIEEKIRIVAQTSWAQNLARGICGKLAGLDPDSEEFKRCVERAARRVAAGLLKVPAE